MGLCWTEPAWVIALLPLWGAVASLDERAWGSIGFGQPLVAGAVAGFLAGSLPAGLVAGVVLQAVWPGLQPIGGDILPAAGVAGVAAGTVAAMTAAGVTGPVVTGAAVTGAAMTTGNSPGVPGWDALGVPAVLGVIAGLAASWGGARWEVATRARNGRREARALGSAVAAATKPEGVTGEAPIGDASARLPDWGALESAARRAEWDSALRGVMLAALAMAAGWLAQRLLLSTREMLPGASSWADLTPALAIIAAGLGLGALLSQWQPRARRGGLEIILGLCVAGVIQLLRAR